MTVMVVDHVCVAFVNAANAPIPTKLYMVDSASVITFPVKDTINYCARVQTMVHAPVVCANVNLAGPAMRVIVQRKLASHVVAKCVLVMEPANVMVTAVVMLLRMDVIRVDFVRDVQHVWMYVTN